VPDLARLALGQLPADMSIQIFDDGGRRLFGPASLAGSSAAIHVGGRTWQLMFALRRSPSLVLPATILGAGALLAVLVALLLRQANRREREMARAERELRSQASITEAVLDATPDGIRVVDLDGTTLLANPALDRLLGPAGWGRDVRRVYEAGDRFAARTTDPDRFRHALSALRADRLQVSDDDYELSESGRIFHRYSAPVRAGADPDEVTGRIFVHREVTAERLSDRAKDEFIALASHELRTPLTSICGYLDILAEGDVGPLVPEQRRVVGVIERNAKRLVRLVDDLLVVARSDAGRLGIVLDDLDLADLARDCVQGASPAAEERGLDLSARVDVQTLPVRADRARLGQVIDNLIANALKFTPPGGQVEVAVAVEGEEALVEVSDTGIGIPRADHARLFERFYRTSQAIAAAAPGSGLGLAISKMIVDAHGGRIQVESEDGAGATFRVLLPLATTARPASPAAYEAAPSA
jgi:signal transduction histidine kinase